MADPDASTQVAAALRTVGEAFSKEVDPGAPAIKQYILNILEPVIKMADLCTAAASQMRQFDGAGSKLEKEVQVVKAQLAEYGARDDLHFKVIELVEATKGSKGKSNRIQGILDCKAVSGLPMLTNDKARFKGWNTRMINAVSQVRVGARNLLTEFMSHIDQEATGDFEINWEPGEWGS